MLGCVMGECKCLMWGAGGSVRGGGMSDDDRVH